MKSRTAANPGSAPRGEATLGAPASRAGAKNMDRVYKRSIPDAIHRLEALRTQFADVDPKTDWTRLRVEPLLAHAKSLRGLLRSRSFARETSRLRTGVGMFHADLVYLQDNIRGLEKILISERTRALRRR
jgi:hypothetical protein